MERVINKRKASDKAPTIIIFVLLTVYAASMILLVLWGLSAALKTWLGFYQDKLGPPAGWPWAWEWKNFQLVFDQFVIPIVSDGVQKYRTIWDMLLYTLLYAGVGAFINTLVPCLVAYVVAKFDYKFSKLLYTVVIVCMILPIVGAAPSEISLLKTLHLYDTFWGNWIQKFHFLGMYFLVFHAAFKGISKELSEAAYVDGAGEYQVLFRLILPLVSTVFATVMLIKFIEFWNDYQTPLLYLPSHPTLAYGVYWIGFTSVGAMATVPMRMAACMLVLVPVLTLFVVFRNRLMGNLMMGGVKE
ncbi:MAG: carbohydrate ABC transporter permease [Clostridiales bacterium]|jgi:ABC-type glycerol-3-phosphate transport system permease component|nr:carbohydrate ABC transporter permease [Clostridiales bacterium]